MEQHQSRKVEIDAREDSFQDVVKMGKDLIAKNHYATPEVKSSLLGYFLFVWSDGTGWSFLMVNSFIFWKPIFFFSFY